MTGARTKDQWAKTLAALTVAPREVALWAPIFADTIKERTFSLGEQEFADFLGQIVHESARLTAMVENLSYSADRIRQLAKASPAGSRWAAAGLIADRLANQPEKLAAAIYDGRMGNVKPGDGWLYRGRTPIGITGLRNYEIVGEWMGQDLVTLPGLLEQPHFALEACIAWWEGSIPDSIIGDGVAVRRRVNGGTFGLSETLALTERAKKELA